MPPPTGYIDQHPDELHLTVVDHPVTQDFAVYARQTCELAGFRIDASIIGASHIMAFNRGDQTLNELLACVRLPLPVMSIGLGNLLADAEGAHRRMWGDGWAYGFTCRHVSWTDPEPDDLVQLVAKVRGHNPTRELGLLQEFPAGDLQVTPKTVIYGRATSARSVVIETAHSYPNVRGLVLSRTQLTMPEEGES